MEKKSILLIVGSNLCEAGVPGVIMYIVRNLYTKYTFDVLCFDEEEGFFDKEFLSYGGKIIRKNLVRYEENKISYLLRSKCINQILKEIFKRKKYEIVHCNCGIESGICLKTAHDFNIKIRIAHAHGTYNRKGRNYLLRLYNYRNKRRIVQYATERIACSSIAGETLFLGKSFENVLNPVNLSIYDGIIKKKHSGIHLLQIGYYCSNKNQMFSAKVVKWLLEHGYEVMMYFIGFINDEKYYAQLKQYVIENHMEKNIKYLPSDYDKSKAFEWADYCLLPSNSEGLSLVSLEAQASKTKCIMSKHISRDADFGFAEYIEYNNVEAWAEYISGNNTIATDSLNEKLKAVSIESYVRRIELIYECENEKRKYKI